MKRFAVFVTLSLLLAACGGASTTTTAATTATAAGTARSLDLAGVPMEIHTPPG